MFWDNFVKLCDEKCEKPNPVAKKLNIASGTITAWKNGGVPSGKSLQKISDYFGVSVDYLLGKTENPSPEQSNKSSKVIDFVFAQTAHERDVMAAYRSQPELQMAVDKLLGLEIDDKVYLYTAAHSDDKRLDDIMTMPKKDWERIKQAPQTDEDLM